MDLIDKIDHAVPLLATFSFNELRKGVDCPTCGKFAKINNKKLNHTMCLYLKLLYSNKDWVQASRMRIPATTKTGEIRDIQTGDYKILAKWGLAEEHPDESGKVRISRLGIDFVEGRVLVRSALLLMNDKNLLVGFDGPEVSFAQAYGTSFDPLDL